MSRKESGGPACAFDLAGDSDSDSEDEVQVRTGRSVGREDAEDRSTASSRRVQGRAAGSMRVHSLSGPSPVSAQAASEMVQSDADWNEVRVSYRMCASLRELADGEVDPSLKLAASAMKIFDNSENRTENHICGGVRIVEFDSTFPASLHVDVEGLADAGTAKSFTQSGTCGALTMRPRASFSDARGIEVAAGNMEKAQKSAFLREYKGWNLNNVNKRITFCADGVNAMVESDHPIVAYYNSVLNEAGDDPIGDDDLIEGTTMFMAKVTDVNECLESLKRTMQENLQIQNLYNVSFKLRRAYGEAGDDGEIAWDDAEEVLDGVQSSKTGDAIMDQKRTLYMTAAFKVRTLD